MAPNSNSTKKSPIKKKLVSKAAAPTINGKRVTVTEKTVSVLSMLRTIGKPAPTRDLVMKMCGFQSSGSFNVTMSKEAKKENALVALPDGKTIMLTNAGVDSAPSDPDADAICDDTDLQKYLKKVFKLGGNVGKMFDLLCDGQIHTNDDLARACGKDHATASTNVQRSKLTSPKLAEKTTCGGYRLTSSCFLT